MSEPASLIVHCRIAPQALRHVLAAREPRVSGWSDWHRLEAGLAAHELADLDLKSGMTTADMLTRLRDTAERPADWLFAYDAASGGLTIGQTLFSANWLTIVPVLAGLRRLGLAGEGIILVHDWIYGQRGTLATVSLGAGGSQILDRAPADVQALAEPVLAPVRDAVVAGAPAPLRDDLGEWSGPR